MSTAIPRRRVLPIILAATVLQLAGPGVAHASGGHHPTPRRAHQGQALALPTVTLAAGSRSDADAPAVAAV